MKISTEINSIAKHIGEREAIELCAKAGFDMLKVYNPKICRSNDVSIDIKEIIEKEVIFLKKSVKQFLAFAVLMTLNNRYYVSETTLKAFLNPDTPILIEEEE